MKQRESGRQGSLSPKKSNNRDDRADAIGIRPNCMKNDSEQKPSSLYEEEEKLWGFYLAVGVQGAEELRKELGTKEWRTAVRCTSI
jgi:hypothetical protein